MANINVKGLIKEADAALKERDRIKQELAPVTERTAALRELLRYAVVAGEATEDEKAWIDETFPPRQRKSKDGAEAEVEGDEENGDEDEE
jgi:hypothetical protein